MSAAISGAEEVPRRPVKVFLTSEQGRPAAASDSRTQPVPPLCSLWTGDQTERLLLWGCSLWTGDQTERFLLWGCSLWTGDQTERFLLWGCSLWTGDQAERFLLWGRRGQNKPVQDFLRRAGFGVDRNVKTAHTDRETDVVGSADCIFSHHGLDGD